MTSATHRPHNERPLESSSGDHAHLARLPITTLSAETREFLDAYGIDDILVFATPMTIRFRGITQRDGLLLHGPQGWGECAPFWDYDARESSAWLRAALESATQPAPAAHRTRVPVNVTIPVEPAADAAARVLRSGGCLTAKVKVADPRSTVASDIERIEAVADALAESARRTAREHETPGTLGSADSLTAGSYTAGSPTFEASRAIPFPPPTPHIRIDANMAWSVDEAAHILPQLDRAAAAVGGLEYAEQPCRTVEELADIRRKVAVPIAADESIRRATDPLRVAQLEAADIAVVKIAPLGGIPRALEIAADVGLDVVISSALDSSVGLAAGLAAAAALPGQTRACGLATSQLLTGDVTPDRLLPSCGAMTVRPVSPELSWVSSPDDVELLRSWQSRLENMVAVVRDRKTVNAVRHS